jgi:hypothetical protein
MLDSNLFKILDYMDFAKALELWRRYFGKENLIIRVYEKEQLPDGIYADFLQTVGLSWNEEYILPEPDSSNLSLQRDILEFLRLCNAIPMESEVYSKLTKVLRTVSIAIGKKAYFSSHNLLSPQERIALLQHFECSNQQVARDYLGRENGLLFYEPWPSPDENWEPYAGLTTEKLATICGGLLAALQEDINFLHQHRFRRLHTYAHLGPRGLWNRLLAHARNLNCKKGCNRSRCC